MWTQEITDSYIKNPQEAELYYEGFRLGISSENFLIEQEIQEHYTLEQAKQIMAEDYYEYGLMQYNLRNYKLAKNYYKKSYDLVEDTKYKEAVELVNSQIQIANTYKYYTISHKSYLKGDYEKAKVKIEQALKIFPDNRDYLQLSEKISKQTVEIMNSSREAILTLDGFNEHKANAFIKAREEGAKWYDIDSFADDFEISGYEKLQIQNRLIFPLKQGAKLGRRIDF